MRWLTDPFMLVLWGAFLGFWWIVPAAARDAQNRKETVSDIHDEIWNEAAREVDAISPIEPISNEE